LVADHAGDEFATCIYGAIDLGSKHLVWANAGHPPLLLADGGTTAYLPIADQPPLGVGATHALVHERAVGSGAVLLAFTDGLVEQPAESLDVGLDRLRGVVDAHLDAPLDELCELLGMAMFEDRERRDDVCVLALRTGA
ncbi:MAG TPA: PP2C family protein-serine/threonine phosphatase, partial [Acidimicrobiales bacterium]|nr:PP2C family protein-serine/threonine phosphatase [Acidimicrobiales bacterium]